MTPKLNPYRRLAGFVAAMVVLTPRNFAACHALIVNHSRTGQPRSRTQEILMKSVRAKHASSFLSAWLVTALAVLILAASALPAQAQTYTVLYTAPGGPGIANPVGNIAQGRDGNLYTVGNQGGTFYGSIFKLTPAGVESLVYDIGYFPNGGLNLGTDGLLYGVDGDGGVVANCGLSAGGQVYKVTTAGTLTVLHNFTGNGDGCSPQAPPIQAANGTFYGTTESTAYSVTSTGVFTTLHTFTGTDGATSYPPLVQGTDGNFYGVTQYGGTSGDGVIYKMSAAGTVTVLHNLNGVPDGAQPTSAMIQGRDGNFYGVTTAGGSFYGTVFKITPSGVFTVLHTFASGPTEGSAPISLVQATDGKLYGVTNGGGTTGGGTIYSISTAGTFSVLYNFANSSTSGFAPDSPLRQDTSGLFYGSTYNGGATSTCNCGVVYSFNAGLGSYANLLATSGKLGAKVGILGQGFTTSSVVKFGGVQASAITLSGSTYITATVPVAAKTAAVTVTTGATTLTTPQTFRVLPTITSFTPTSGPVGTLVSIIGTELTQTTKVTFNGKSASFTAVSDEQVTATVPTGATTGKIAITTKGGTATSATNFTVN